MGAIHSIVQEAPTQAFPVRNNPVCHKVEGIRVCTGGLSNGGQVPGMMSMAGDVEEGMLFSGCSGACAWSCAVMRGMDAGGGVTAAQMRRDILFLSCTLEASVVVVGDKLAHQHAAAIAADLSPRAA